MVSPCKARCRATRRVSLPARTATLSWIAARSCKWPLPRQRVLPQQPPQQQATCSNAVEAGNENGAADRVAPYEFLALWLQKVEAAASSSAIDFCADLSVGQPVIAV